MGRTLRKICPVPFGPSIATSVITICARVGVLSVLKEAKVQRSSLEVLPTVRNGTSIVSTFGVGLVPSTATCVLISVFEVDLRDIKVLPTHAIFLIPDVDSDMDIVMDD